MQGNKVEAARCWKLFAENGKTENIKLLLRCCFHILLNANWDCFETTPAKLSTFKTLLLHANPGSGSCHKQFDKQDYLSLTASKCQALMYLNRREAIAFASQTQANSTSFIPSSKLDLSTGLLMMTL